MSKKISPSWVPKNLTKTVGGQHVGLEPLYCESTGASDYCMHCGRDMGYTGTPSKPCHGLESLRLAMVPYDQVLAFGCSYEAEDLAHPIPGHPATPCETWCRSPDCPVSIRAPATTDPLCVLEPGDTATVYHAGTNQYYHAKILNHMSEEDVQRESDV